MAGFLQRLIPVDLTLWILFFLLPGTAAFAWQLITLVKTRKKILWFVPYIAALLLFLYVFLLANRPPFESVTGGFVALLLLGSVLFLIGGGLFGVAVWFAFIRPFQIRREREEEERSEQTGQ